jgi:molybdopterin-guanine dinucleotide biosynthesis protein A
MATAGLLLTGGASRRMGRDKARLVLIDGRGYKADPSGSDVLGGLTLAERTARLLAAATTIAVEVGPGFSHLPHVSESPPGSGPLAALVAGSVELGRLGHDGPVLVVATDLPRLTHGMLDWLARLRSGRSVVPEAGGRLQPLCARYEAPDVAVAARLVEGGATAMSALFEAIDPLLVSEETWSEFAGDPRCLDDLDTPDQLDAYLRTLP